MNNNNKFNTSISETGAKSKKRQTKTITGKPADKINTSPTLEKLRESAVITFGRFNPPTAGHEKLVNIIKEHQGDKFVFLSKVQGKKDPLDYYTKLAYCEEAFGSIVKDYDGVNVFDILEQLSPKYKTVTLIVGEDRIEEFSKRIPLYFDNVQIESVSRSLSDISSSKMRTFIQEGNLDSYLANIPSSLRNKDELVYSIVEELDEVLNSENNIHEVKSADTKRVPARNSDGSIVWRNVRKEIKVESTSEKIKKIFKKRAIKQVIIDDD